MWGKYSLIVLKKINRNVLFQRKIIYTLITLFLVVTLSVYGQNNLNGSLLNVYKTPVTNNFNDLIDLRSEYLWSITGTASYYGKKFHLRKTASGARFDKNENSAAHRKLPFGTILRVINNNNEKSTLVRINDRGPYSKNRIIDLSLKAAKDISGLGLPNVTLSGFVPGKFNYTNELSSYYVAYSQFDDPELYSQDLFEIIENDKDFQVIVDEYNNLLNSNQSFESNLFILINLNEYNFSPSKVTYQLGYFKNFEPKRIPFSVAEREKK